MAPPGGKATQLRGELGPSLSFKCRLLSFRSQWGKVHKAGCQARK